MVMATPTGDGGAKMPTSSTSEASRLRPPAANSCAYRLTSKRRPPGAGAQLFVGASAPFVSGEPSQVMPNCVQRNECSVPNCATPALDGSKSGESGGAEQSSSSVSHTTTSNASSRRKPVLIVESVRARYTDSS